jgi:hypothetical protein
MRRTVLLAALLALAAVSTAADLKIVTRSSSANGLHKSILTKYVQGQRQRFEYGRSAARVTLQQCDAKKQIDLNLEQKLYGTTELDTNGLPLGRRMPSPPSSKYTGPSYHYVITTEDTGQRAKVFGYDAWHVRETTVTTTSTSSKPSKTLIDYWYIDLDVPTDGCYAWPEDWRAAMVAADGRHTLKRIGTAKRGFPVLKRTVFHNIEGKPSEHVIEVTEISTAPLDPKLFEIPKDFQPALKVDNRILMNVPDTPTNRLKATWDGFWVSLAKFIY